VNAIKQHSINQIHASEIPQMVNCYVSNSTSLPPSPSG